MSSSKLPQTGVLAASPFLLGMQLIGVIIIAFVSAYIFYKYIKKDIC